MFATPSLMAKVAFSSEKSVFSVALASWVVDLPTPAPASSAWASRSFCAMLMPLTAPSRNCSAALPASARFMLPTLAPVVVIASLMLPRPSSRSLSTASFMSGSICTLTRLASSPTRLPLACALAFAVTVPP